MGNKCSLVGCNERTEKGFSYCAIHKCCVPHCHSFTKDKYCKTHKCGTHGCPAKKTVFSTKCFVCSNVPMCKTRGCTMDVFYGTRYCESHKCSLLGCSEFRENKIFCKEHTCIVPNCNNLKFSTQDFCKEHSCKRSGCEEKRGLHSDYCNTHNNELIEDCSLCLDGMYTKDELFKTKCEHIFHKDCFDEFNLKICPLCRSDLLQKIDFP